MFDLDQAVASWKSALSESRTLSADDLAELESHLRDSVDRLRSVGLSPDESFFIATRRLGHPDSLATEYGLAHPERHWRERAIWMITGLLTFNVCSAAGGFAGQVALIAGSFTGIHGPNLGRFSLATTLLGYAVAIAGLALAWRRLRVSSGVVATRLVLIAIAFLVVQQLLQSVSWAIIARHTPPGDLGHVAFVSGIAAFTWALLFPVAIGTLLLRLRRSPA
jgi:hypothetical protein